jgi:signal transduction histidine kinase
VRWFDDLPLRRRLSLVILATCTTTLLLAFAAIAAFELVSFRRTIVREAAVLADMLGTNTQAALAFKDEAAARVVLGAVAADPNVVAARIFTQDGAPFADYATGGGLPPLPAHPEVEQQAFTPDHLELSRPIFLEGRRIGSISLRVQLTGMHDRAKLLATIGAVVLVTALLVAYLLSAALQRPISGPILALADIARGVAERKDYTVRAPPQGRNEVGVLTDAFNHMLTEIDQQNRRLQQQAEELSRSNAELEQFTYISSHDLKEPLRMVTMYMGLLERKHGHLLDAEATQFMRYAVEGAARLQQLIEDILAYARLDRPDAAFEPVPLDEVVAEAIANNRAEIERLRAEVSIGDLPTVAGDRSQLVQLFQNLIGNAVKFHGEAPPRVRISAARAGAETVISVRDHGIGIEPAYRQRIFDMFQRLHSRSEYPGTGIGLSICRKIVERHGGRIWVDSHVGEGSVFSFTLGDAATGGRDARREAEAGAAPLSSRV